MDPTGAYAFRILTGQLGAFYHCLSCFDALREIEELAFNFS